MQPFEKSLRSGGSQSSTPRSQYNNRYGPVDRGSRGPADADEHVSSSPVSRTDSDSSLSAAAAAAGRNSATPRQAGRFGTPSRDTPTSKGVHKVRSGLSAPPRPPVSRHNHNSSADAEDGEDRDDASVVTEDDYGPQEGDSVQVFVRIRPTNDTEAADADSHNCTRQYGERSLCVDLRHRSEPYHFKFDCVLPETTSQEEVFERAGKPIVDNCMGGYNSSIFAYGQTGAGKTYTMQGPLSAAQQDDNPQRGLAPRVFQYLFSEIDRAQDDNCHENLTFCCKCSMLEIYNEVITDLLNPNATNLQIREDIKRGCYVEDLSEHTIQNVSDAMRLMRIGAENRHVGETRLNRESSRSHSVFTCVLERQSKNQATGITNVLFSRLNLIDLAGSERVHGGEHGGSQATGKHFKEACHINKSLTTLGRVITELVEAQRSAQTRGNGGKASVPRPRHVPYRDSRLTFLLQDSLGGNAKTLMIANISPSSVSGLETLSTLQFMSRAKCIRNRAQINLDARGDVALLQREILRLNNELDNLRKGYTEPAIQENKQLREELDKLRAEYGEVDLKTGHLERENNNLKSERRRLDNKLAQIQKGSAQLTSAFASFSMKLFACQQQDADAIVQAQAIAEVEKQLLQAELAAAQQQAGDTSELQELLEQHTQQLQDAQAAAVAAQATAEAAEAAQASLKAQLEEEQVQNSSLAEQLSTVQQEAAKAAQQLEAARQQATELQQQLQTSTQQLEALQGQLGSSEQGAAALTEQLVAAQQEASGLKTQLTAEQDKSAELAQQLAAATQGSDGLHQQLQSAQQEVAGLKQQLEAAGHQQADTAKQLEAARDKAEQLGQELQQERTTFQEQLSELTAALKASKAEADAVQQQLQDSQSKAQQLHQEGDGLREQLAQQQQSSAELRKSLAAVQEQLAAAEAEVARTKDQASCSATEAGERLAKALEAAESSQAALQEERSNSSRVQEELQALQQQLAQVQQKLQEEVDAHQQDSAAAASTQAAADAKEQQIRKQLDEVQQLLAAKQEDLNTLAADTQELQGKLGEQQQQCSELQQQLAAEAGKAAQGCSQVSALEEALAELNASVKDKASALAAAQNQIKQLQQAAQQKEDALSAATAKQEQLSSDLEALREGSKGKQEELMKQVTEMHLQLSAAQQEQERVQEELDALRNDNSALQAQLTDAQAETNSFRGQASSKGLEVELLRKKLSAAEGNITSLRTDLQSSQQEAAQLRAQAQALESEAGEAQAAAEGQLHDLKRVLLDKDQLLQEYEYERSQMQRRMEELGQRLADKSSHLEGSKSEVQALKAKIRDQANAARRQEATLADQTAFARQLQTENASLSSKLQEVQEQLADREAELRGRLNMNEMQLKEQMVYNVRNRQAMNEIRKVINWAQQMPGAATTPQHGSQVSRPGSSASRRMPLGHPLGALDTASMPGSPGSSQYGDLLPGEQAFEGHEHLEDATRMTPPTLVLPSSNGGSSRQLSSHGYSSSRPPQQPGRQGEHRYYDAAGGAAVGSGDLAMGGRGSSSNGSRRVGCKGSTASSPGGAHLAAGRTGDALPLVLQEPEDLGGGADSSTAACNAERDTAGGSVPAGVLPEHSTSLPSNSSHRSRGQRICSPTRSSGSKQLAAALAAAQHKMPPDQQHHHERQQERYAADVEDDTLLLPCAEDSFEGPEGHTYASRSRGQAAGDGRHFAPPQQASSPTSSPCKEHHHSGIGRNRAGRDSSARHGVRAGSDSHNFSSLSSKQHRHKMVPGEAHPVVLSMSGEWSAGGHDMHDMRLPAAIVGDDGSEA